MSRLIQFIHEIHRRSLWQVLMIYLGASWAVMEATNQIVEQYLLPEWVYPAALILLLIGFPIVLATAFVREDREAAPVREMRDPTLLGTAPPETTRPAVAKTVGSPLARLLSWRRAMLGGVLAFTALGLVSAWVVIRGTARVTEAHGAAGEAFAERAWIVVAAAAALLAVGAATYWGVTAGGSAAPAPTPTPTATPTPENECQCVPHRVVPSGNLAVLEKTTARGNRSKQKKKVGVVLKAREQTRGACRPGSSTDTVSLRLRMVDDDGDVFFDETRTDLTCNRRVGQEKFEVTYEVENCAGSVAPTSRSSKGEVTVTATTEDGELISTRILKCNK